MCSSTVLASCGAPTASLNCMSHNARAAPALTNVNHRSSSANVNRSSIATRTSSSSSSRETEERSFGTTATASQATRNARAALSRMAASSSVNPWLAERTTASDNRNRTVFDSGGLSSAFCGENARTLRMCWRNRYANHDKVPARSLESVPMSMSYTRSPNVSLLARALYSYNTRHARSRKLSFSCRVSIMSFLASRFCVMENDTSPLLAFSNPNASPPSLLTSSSASSSSAARLRKRDERILHTFDTHPGVRLPPMNPSPMNASTGVIPPSSEGDARRK
mmetsp:Transcript_3474/g.12506  ORF Transcript_3474/g.12506 Transcript_3474/m.12506 type:complete len:280 (+) Transcript_3474:3127-3966(+)